MKLTGEPIVVPNCHCHSCVAASKFIDEKHGDHKDHISGIDQGGSAGAMFKPNQVEAITELSPELFGCVKVGPKGKSVRKYVKCCGTQFGVAHPAFWGLNRNAMFENNDDEGTTTKYVPAQAPVNGMKKYAFDPDSVPEPSVNMAKAGDMFKFMGLMLNPFGQRINKDVLATVTLDDDVAEEVPITWE